MDKILELFNTNIDANRMLAIELLGSQINDIICGESMVFLDIWKKLSDLEKLGFMSKISDINKFQEILKGSEFLFVFEM